MNNEQQQVERVLNAGRMIQTFTGRFVDVFDPKPEMFCIEDIAHALSNLCRWGGHCHDFYSVAQHSVLCCDAISIDNSHLRYAALMHDATEAYLVDIPRPIKHQIPQYIEIENNLMKCIAEWAGFEYPLASEVKETDNQILWYEHKTLIQNQNLKCLKPVQAERLFLSKYIILRGKIFGEGK